MHSQIKLGDRPAQQRLPTRPTFRCLAQLGQRHPIALPTHRTRHPDTLAHDHPPPNHASNIAPPPRHFKRLRRSWLPFSAPLWQAVNATETACASQGQKRTRTSRQAPFAPLPMPLAAKVGVASCPVSPRNSKLLGSTHAASNPRISPLAPHTRSLVRTKDSHWPVSTRSHQILPHSTTTLQPLPTLRNPFGHAVIVKMWLMKKFNTL